MGVAETGASFSWEMSVLHQWISQFPPIHFEFERRSWPALLFLIMLVDPVGRGEE
jgi:hypothetical protein